MEKLIDWPLVIWLKPVIKILFPMDRGLSSEYSSINENNFWFYLRNLADNEDHYSSPNFGYSWINSVRSEWPNFVYRVQSQCQDNSYIMEHFSIAICQGLIPSVFAIGPDSNSEEFAEKLAEGPFQLIDMWPGMVYKGQIEKTKIKLIPNFQIVKVNNIDYLNQWIEIINLEFFPNIIIDHSNFSKLLNDDRFIFYLGTKDNVPIATSLLVNDGSSIGLYMISTRKAYRNLGIGYNMTVQPIIDSYRMNQYLPIILQATTIGKSLYEKLGFMEVCNFFIMKYIE